MKLDIKKVDYTLEEQHGHKRPVMNIICRDENNKQRHIINDEVEPYFYVKEDEYDLGIENHGKVTKVEHGYTSIYGDELVKVYTYIPGDVPKVRKDYEHYEADILFPNRFLIDSGIKNGMEIPDHLINGDKSKVPLDEINSINFNTDTQIIFCDIEVNDDQGFPDEEDAIQEIYSISLYNNFTDEYHCYLYHPNTQLKVNHDDAEIHLFNKEQQMLSAFADYINEVQPDMIAGWNFKSFDARYLVNRFNYLPQLNQNSLSPLNSAYDEGSWYGARFKGIAVFDMLKAYKNLQFSDLDSYELEEVAQSVLGFGKVKDSRNVHELWKEDPDKLIEYNVKDVELTVELEKAEQIIKFYEEVAAFVGGRVTEVLDYSDGVDIYILRKVNEKYVLPSKKTIKSRDNKFEGADVLDPATSIRTNVSVLDLASLYPFSMKTLNAGPTTIDPDGEITAPNGVSFTTEKESILSDIIDELLEEREKKKELRDQFNPSHKKYKVYDRQQAAVKIIMNALYGVSGWERFRLYDKDVASAVTAVGRKVITYTAKTVENMGKDVIYGDTDSVMLEFGAGYTINECIIESFDIENKINNVYDDFAKEELNVDEHYFEIEFEKLYKKYLQAGKKKRYAGHIIWKEGQHVDDIDITGFEFKRSDYGKVAREFQKDLIETIVKGGDFNDIKNIIETEIDRIKSGKYNIDELGIPGSINKEFDAYKSKTQHVKAAEYVNEHLSEHIKVGDKPKKLFVSRIKDNRYPKLPEDNEGNMYICWINAESIPDDFVWDWDTYIEKQIKAPTERVLEGTEWTWDEVISGNMQTGVSSYSNNENGSVFDEQLETNNQDMSINKKKQKTEEPDKQTGMSQYI